ncbi:NB-ARC domain-containing protein [Streptomyces sp. NPDC054784]
MADQAAVRGGPVREDGGPVRHGDGPVPDDAPVPDDDGPDEHPVPVRRFVGRERELRALRADIARAGLNTLSGRPAPHSRVLLIVGRPGSGRTALAEQLAERLAADYPDGVLRARLTGPGGVPVPAERTARELLAALDAGPVVAGADRDELTEALRTALAGRRALLLLDDVAEPEQLLELLPDNRDCLVVAVASGPLKGVSDVRPCTLGGLDRAAAVELLRARAGAAPRITVDPRRAESLAEACGDLPAALCLVGGWLASRPKLSVSDATARLEEVPPPLDGRNPDFLGRAFRLVHSTLPPPAARLARLLALAPAGFVDRHTASALAGCTVPAAGAALEGLAELGLLHPVAPGCWTVPGCLDPLLRAELTAAERPADVMLARARMLERTVRQLRACWAAGEPEGSPARRKLAGLPRDLRFADAAEAHRWLTLRQPAVLASVRLAVAEGGGELDTLARRLIHAVSRAYDTYRDPEESAPEVYRLHELVLEIAGRGAGRPRERAAALLELADLDARAGRLRQAAGRYRAALDAARAADDAAATGRALESLGGAYADLADWARAADWYARALALRQAHDDLVGVARLHARVAAAHTRSGRLEAALREWRSAAATHRRLRDRAGQARALGEFARVQEYAGRPQEAYRACREALTVAERTEDRPLQAALRVRLADACARLGDERAARAHRAAAERLLRHTESAEAATGGAEKGPDQGS